MVLTESSERMVRREPEMAGKKVFRWETAHLLDGVMAIVIDIEIPEPFFTQVADVDDTPMPVKHFLKHCTNRDPAYFISWIVAESRPEIREWFNWGGDVI